MKRRIAILALSGVFGAATSVSAADSPYELDPPREWALVGVGTALGASSLLLMSRIEPLSMEDLDRLDIDGLNKFDRAGYHPYRPERSGDFIMGASCLFPLTFLARDDMREDVETLGALWGEATLLNLGLNGIVKALVLRERPYAYDPDAPTDERTGKSARFSFYSGHAAMASMNCFFAARVYSDYLDDDMAETALWTAAALYPALVGFLRVDSGHHFRTDVIAGYLIGAAIGYLIPEMHERGDKTAPAQSAPSRGSFSIGLRFAF